MSETLQENPFKPGTPEYDEYMRTYNLIPSGLLAGALQRVLPAQRDDQGNVTPALPGMVSGAYSFLGGTLPDLANLGGKALGYDFNIPHAPGADAAAEMNRRTGAEARTIAPPSGVDEVSGGRVVYDLANAAGGAAVPIPTGLVSALPKAVQGVAPLLLGAPTLKHVPTAIALGVGLTGAAEAAQAATQPDEDKDGDLESYLKQQVQARSAGGQQLPTPPIPPAQIPADQGGPQTPPFQATPVMQYLVRQAKAK